MENKEDEQRVQPTREMSVRSRQEDLRGPKSYFVDKVVNHRFNQEGLPEFHVFWKGYPAEQSTWEPLTNVLDNQQFFEYWSTLSETTRKNIRIPGNYPIGSDRDGLCVRRAVERLHLPDVDLKKFGPWMQLDHAITTLREEGCSVKKLRKNQRIRWKKLLCIKGGHAYGLDITRRSSKVRNKYQVIYVVKKRTRMRHSPAFGLY